ncbi:putative manganese-dependent inorganic diphosphatase [Atopobium deltae]|uniref:inorganic diphosphatase n=1 Tax=Atopobium deltae TaxID=1393034 RepID=A0A133XPX1_9ACTN|nr:putative manganese-dependent inorganic diphosphatase [Atopobium deltae]KXB32985.1 CBS domain protein [Atopobium deltae]
MADDIRKVYVFGHLHPDTDSIGAAIGYAYLKNQIDKPIYQACRTARINLETAFALKHFGFDEPPLIETAAPQIADAQVQTVDGIAEKTTISEALALMKKQGLTLLAVVDKDKTLLGAISRRTLADVMLTRIADGAEAADELALNDAVSSVMIAADKLTTVSVANKVADAKKTLEDAADDMLVVVDRDGKYHGLVNASDLENVTKKRVILVDHNERTQAADGIEEAEILEIIDHHRIGSIETNSPAYFRNEPVGCTCTILYDMYNENNVKIPANIAGILLSAIMSDTLCFRSPTCTPRDVKAGRALAEICGEDLESYADSMFDAGADLTGRTAADIFGADFKIFERGDVRFGVGQASFMTENSRKAAEELVGPYLKDGAAENEIPAVFYLFTDIKSKTSEMLYWGKDADKIVEKAFGVAPVDDIATLVGVVSRKKQVAPNLMATLEEYVGQK